MSSFEAHPPSGFSTCGAESTNLVLSEVLLKKSIDWVMWNKYKYKYLLMFANYVPVAPSAAKNSSEGSNWGLKKKKHKS